MVSKSVIRLIDEAILPAAALICAKMAGLLFASHFFNLTFIIQNSAFFKVLPQVYFPNLPDYVKAENFSNFAMLLVSSLGTLYVLLRAHFFHETHIRPQLHAKLARFNLAWLIAPTYRLYHQAAIWLVFLWLTSGFIISSSFAGITYPYIAIIAFLISANFSWIFALDVEREIEITSLKI